MKLMSLVSHKESYLVCVELTNFQIFAKPIPISFFQNMYKTETANRGQRHCLIINKYYIILVNSTIRYIPKSFSNEKPRTLVN